MAEMMQAAVVREFGQPLAIQEVKVPEMTEDRVLVKVAACGVCHTDLHAADGDWPVKPSLPFIPGHEGVGYVAKLGRRVKHIKEGDRVGVPWLHTACGYCEYCITGWETLCDRQQMTGYTVNGSYAQYVLADPSYVGKLPDEVGFGEATCLLFQRQYRTQVVVTRLIIAALCRGEGLLRGQHIDFGAGTDFEPDL